MLRQQLHQMPANSKFSQSDDSLNVIRARPLLSSEQSDGPRVYAKKV
jgi:hypothetical protein